MGNEKLEDLEPQGEVKGGVRASHVEAAVRPAVEDVHEFAADHAVEPVHENQLEHHFEEQHEA